MFARDKPSILIDACGSLMEEEIVVGASSMADEQSDAGDENERCGICMEFVIDRGVLDCCSHWFCFKCIDNWAIITNLCPLCKSQFQLITCLPVYDTLGSIDLQQHSSGLGETESDESWCIYGKNNALSFPSYYIDEDAVVCLEGDGCRVRSGVTTAEEEQSSTLDTSVACDSCDIWYHAICVGFDPNGTIEGSWLCPRCETSVLKDSNSSSFQIITPKSPQKDILTWDAYENTLLKSKVSVSVADAGETAVVISMVEGESHGLITQDSLGVAVPGKQDEDGASVPVCDSVNASDSMKSECIEPLKELSDNAVNLGAYKDSTVPSAVSDSESVLDQESSQMPCVLYNKGNPADTLLRSNTMCSLVQSPDIAMPVSLVEDYGICDLLSQNDNLGKSEIAKLGKEEKKMLAVFDNAPNFSCQEKLQGECGGELSRESQDVDLSIHLDGTTHSSSSADKPAIKNGNVEDRAPVGDTTKTANHLLSGPKRKRGWKDGDAPNNRDPMECHHQLGQTAKQSEYPIKRARLSGQDEQICLVSSNAHNDINEGTVSKDICGPRKKLITERIQSPKEGISRDLINLVKGPEFCSPERIIANKIENENSQVGVVRMKKIMRRRVDENETTRLVQELTKELKAMDSFGRSDDLGKIDASNEIFLAAFKAAMSRAHEKENNNKSKVLQLGVNQQLLKKGKIRENLTKKLYGTGNGKRRRAWDRDWEIEFWKGRCNKTKQPKKVDTPNTLRELLYRSLDTWSKPSETELGSEAQGADPIFSRLYIADTSLFPRKNDIKPLSACKEPGSLQVHGYTAEAERVKDVKIEESSICGVLKPKTVNDESKGDHAGKPSVCSGNITTKKVPHSVSEHGSVVNTAGNKCKIPRSNIETTAGCVVQNKGSMGLQSLSPVLNSAVPRSTITDEKSRNSGDVKSDKRRWALEVLARKTGQIPSSANDKKMEASLGEKGNFPLLIQLPSDMRPILPHNRRSKVPTSVRQMQLNRLVEHYLKKANLQTIRRTAESEFAVADAVIKEREIYERSNSKSVYNNLCAQALSQQVHSHKVSKKTDDSCDSGTRLNDEVTEALKATGLISDSPHESPYRISENSDSESDHLVENKADLTNSVDNVLDLDCHPALDIYGDFEYDLDDLDISGSSSLSYSSRIPAIKSDNAASKVKVVLSMGHCNMHAADKKFHGDNNEDLSTKEADVKAPLERGQECMPDLKPMLLPDVGDACASTGIENSATLNMPMDKRMSSLCSLHDEKDIEPTVMQNPKVDTEQASQEDLGSSLNGLFTNSIDGNPISNLEQSLGDNYKSNQMERAIISSSCPVKHRSSIELINDQVDEVVNNSSSVKLPYVDSEVNNQRKPSPPHVDATISQPDPQNNTTEINIKCPVPAQSERDDTSRKESELSRNNQRLNISHSICKKVEAYVKEHLRPLCKSGVITVEQYRWAVGKTVDKVMKYHSNAKNADFLITEGNKVKKLAEQYLQAFKQKENH